MKFKNHEVLHEINRGAITTVFKARHLNLDRIVLLKVLNTQWLNEKDLIKRFKREARICAHLQHPNIVNVYDFNISADQVYISMEYIEGMSLKRYIHENHPLPFERISALFHDILSALDYAHKKGVIHRDIKPDNILIDKTLKARITDFGLASFQDLPLITEQGQGMGTPAYMAPEQIKGSKSDIKSDLYSLGITFFEGITNNNPFQKENTAATLQSVLTDATTPVSHYRKDIPQWFEKIILDSTAKNPTQRPDSAEIILLELQEKTGLEISIAPEKSDNKKKVRNFSLAAIFFLTILIYFLGLFQKQSLQTETNQEQFLSEDSANGLATKFIIEKDSSTAETKKISDMPDKAIGNTSTDNLSSAGPVKDSEKGSLYIICSPWAKVILDGDTVDTTPMKQPVRLNSGRYSLELYNPNYKAEVRDIEIKAHVNDTLNFKLKPAFGYLLVKAAPWAKLYINDIYKEDTPLERSIIIPEGQSILKLMNPQHGTITDTIFVKAGKTIEKTYSFIN